MQALEEKMRAATSGLNRIIPGAVLVASSRDTDHAMAWGTVSIEEDAAEMQVDTVIWAASCTKLMTTVAALQCVEKSLFTLDEDISRVLPEWESPDILTGFNEATAKPILRKATKSITLRQLLSHSCGMAYDSMSPLLAALRKIQGRELGTFTGDIADAYSAPLIYEPGQGWHYSPGLDWAGQMVERTNNNMRLGEYMSEHIWKPLGMSSTTFRLTERPDLARRLCGMTTRLPTGQLDASPSPPYVVNPTDDEGGVGCYTTAPDYLKLLKSLLQNDGKVLKPETVTEMFEPQLHNPGYLAAALEGPRFARVAMPGMPAGTRWNWGLSGLIATEGLPGRAGRGTMLWGGRPNLQWWIDREAGTCGMYASQLVPSGDEQSAQFFAEFQKAMFMEEVKHET